MASDWIQHVKATQAANPGMSYKAAMVAAKKTYRKAGKRGGGALDDAIAAMPAGYRALAAPLQAARKYRVLSRGLRAIGHNQMADVLEQVGFGPRRIR